MLTVSEDSEDLATALRNGAHGYLLKTMEGDALTSAINRAMVGEHVIAPEMTGKLVSAYRSAATGQPDVQPDTKPASLLETLTPRELDILRAITAGASNKEIARQYAIAETTVKIHVQHILRKLDVSTRVHAAVMASESGLL
jgi:two-component system nitrate/nitrite response regulator NarL